MKYCHLQLALLMLLMLSLAPRGGAEEQYYLIPLASLPLQNEDLRTLNAWQNQWLRRPSVLDAQLIAGQGRIWLAFEEEEAATANPLGGARAWIRPQQQWRDGVILLRSGDLDGLCVRLTVPRSGSDHEAIEVALPEEAERITAERAQLVRQASYRRLAQSGLAGGPWFRARAGGLLPDRAGDQRQIRENEFERSLAMFSGARSIAENLSLDALAPPPDNDQPADPQAVSLATLPDIEQALLPWDELEPEAPAKGPDQLAASIPADQHALFFPSFTALSRVISLSDDSIGGLSAALGWSDGQQLLGHYQRQLGLHLDGISQIFGPRLIQEIAITGGDLSLDLGSDVAVLLSNPNIQQSALAILTDIQRRTGREPQVKRWEEMDVHYFIDEQQGLRSYQVILDEQTLLVTNHLRQLERILAVRSGADAALADDHDYRALRHRYPQVDEERVFIILSDAAIRRWSSAAQRIAESRRIRALAALQALNARSKLGILDEATRELLIARGDLGEAREDGQGGGWQSPRYGSVQNLIPAGEIASILAEEGVSPGEANAYRNWHRWYTRGFSNYFDPIAVHLVEEDEGLVQIGLDVLPLHASSELLPMLDMVGSAVIAPGSGDPHPEALLQWVMAVDLQGETLVSLEQEISQSLPGLRANPLAWIGDSLSVFMDKDPLWHELADSDQDIDRILENTWHSLPIALHVAVKEPLLLAGFLTALRGMSEVSAPGLLEWSTASHGDISYVQIRAHSRGLGIQGDEEGGITLYYAALPEGFWLTLNQGLIQRVLERVAERRSGSEQATAHWQGAGLGMFADQGLNALLPYLWADEHPSPAQQAAWTWIPVLNDIRSEFPDQDPRAIYQELFGRQLQAQGESYYYDPDLNSMACRRHGHPLAPLSASTPPLLGPWQRFKAAMNFDPIGESQVGLRLRLQLER